MNPFAGLIAPALAALPLPQPLAGVVEAGPGLAAVPDAGPGERGEAAGEARGSEPEPWRSFADTARGLREADKASQVRIEQRVIIRIAPGAVRGTGIDDRHGMFSPIPPPMARPPRTIERKMAQCLPMNSIARVQPDGSRLLLFMRDQKIVSATLEKGCSPRDYYSGFLVERPVDGMLCAGRDKLLARSGANCGMDRLRQLVVVDDDE